MVRCVRLGHPRVADAESGKIFNELFGGRTRARTWDPLIKSHQITLIYQAHFDISSVRSRIEPEGQSENVETKIGGPRSPPPPSPSPRGPRALKIPPPFNSSCPPLPRPGRGGPTR